MSGQARVLARSCVSYPRYRRIHDAAADEGRRRIVPLIRAYTDCIADAIRSNVGWLDKAKSGQWREAYGPAAKLCEDSGVEMLVMHEHLYGKGTGITFLRGPYLSDLPRALTSRLQADFNRLDDEVKAAQEKEIRDAAALAEKQKLVAEAVAQHETCLAQAMVDVVPYSAEAAPVLADVILAKCKDFAEHRISIGIAAYSMTRDEATEIVSRKVQEMRAKIVEVIVMARAEAAKRQEASPPGANNGSVKLQPL